MDSNIWIEETKIDEVKGMDLKEEVLIMKALADETRLSIVNMLSKENLCACQLLEEFNLSQATLSYHMKQLQESGLVSGKKDGYWTRYSLEKKSLISLVSLLDHFVEDIEVLSPPIQCRRTDEKKAEQNS